jgi:hypothetical protein
MPATVIKIDRVNAPAVYLPNWRALKAWVKLNPGEAQTWGEVEALEEIKDLQDHLDNANTTIANLQDKLEGLRFRTDVWD